MQQDLLHGDQRALGWAECGLLFILGVQLRLVDLGHPPQWDELYHFFAARAWLADGSFQIEGGASYTRGAAYTLAVAGFFRLFGESIAMARAPSAIAGSLTILVIAMWTGRVAGRRAGLAAGLLLCFCGFSIEISRFARFYSFHTLAFVIGAIGVYVLVIERPAGWRAVLAGLLSVGALGFATSLQITTLIGTAGLYLWTIINLALRWKRQAGARSMLWKCLAWGSPVALILGAAAATGELGQLVERYRYAALWTASQKNNLFFYHEWFLLSYRTLYALLPIAVLLVIRKWPAAGGFCLLLFATALVVHSGAAQKHERYLFYIMPFFFALWGMALSQILGFLWRRIDMLSQRIAARANRALPNRFWPETFKGALARASKNGVVIITAICLAIGNPAFPHGVMTLIRGDHHLGDWSAAVPQLRRIADGSEILIASTDLKTLYYLDRPNIVLSVTALDHGSGLPSPEFTPGWTGRPTISTCRSLKQLMKRHRSGLVIIQRNHWRVPWGVTPSVADLLTEKTQFVRLPEGCPLLAFRWAPAKPSLKVKRLKVESLKVESLWRADLRPSDFRPSDSFSCWSMRLRLL